MIGLSFLQNYQTVLASLTHQQDYQQTLKLSQSFSQKEYECTRWLVNALADLSLRFHNVAIIGSSFSTYLVPMLCTRMKQIDNLVLYDKDPNKIEVARVLHHGIRQGTKIDFCTLDVATDADKISLSSYDLVISPYADRLPEMVNIRTKINKAIYVLQAEVGNTIRDEKDLLVMSGCIQQSFRGVERIAGKQVAMVIGTKRV